MPMQHPPTSPSSELYVDSAAAPVTGPHFAPTRTPAGAPQIVSPAKAMEAKAVDFMLRAVTRETAGNSASLDKLRDVELDVSIELGRTEMALEEVAKLQAGVVVPLDTLAGDLVDVVVNGRLVARGEVVVVDDNFCVRVVELIAGSEAA